MKRGFILLVMLTSVLVMGFAQSALSGTYRYSANAYITFTGNNFSGAWNRTSTMSGTYSVSENRLTLNITGGTVGRNTWNWTIVDANTLRDHDGDSWRKEGGGSQQPAQPPISWTVNSPSDWIEMVNGIRSAGNNKTHIVTVSGTISVIPTPESDNTFGSNTGITVTIQGDGTISPSSNGSLLRIGSGQTVVVKDLALKGRTNNNESVIYIDEGSFSMEGGASVSGNTRSDDDRGTGGVLVHSTGTFIMKDNASVSGNIGHGVNVDGGIFTMQDNASVSGNIARARGYNNTSGYGGGVHVSSYYYVDREYIGTFTMQGNASVSGNTAGSTGGGVYVVGTFTMRDSASISDNTSRYGGGVYVSGTFNMQDNASVSGNTATAAITGGGYGGGVYVSGTFNIQGVASVSGNTAGSRGGGVYVDRGTFTMRDSASVSGNTAGGGYNGGGVYVSDGGTFTMRDSASVSGNTADEGGGVYVQGTATSSGTFNMQGGTISGNTARKNGGGVFVSGTFTMQGGTISGNTASGNGGGVYVVGGTFTKSGGTIYGSNETDVKLRNTASSGHALYNANRSWRNATAGPTMNPDTFGFWMND